MQKLIKVAQFTTIEKPNTINTVEYLFRNSSKYNSKLIFTDLNAKYNLSEIISVSTKVSVKEVVYTTVDNPESIQTMLLDADVFKTSKSVFDYLTNLCEIDFIHSIERKYVLR